MMVLDITSELILKAYRQGIFPMAEDRNDPTLYWYKPQQRGIIPLDGFHLSRRLARTIVNSSYSIVTDQDFAAVIEGCAKAVKGREETWINDQIKNIFLDLHHQGYAHSIEVREQGHLIGGLYGLAIGQAFFGESMFSRRQDSSKIALVHLVARLRLGNFQLLDTQFMTAHLAQFGGIEIADYYERLQQAIQYSGQWLGNDNQVEILSEIRLLRQQSSSIS